MVVDVGREGGKCGGGGSFDPLEKECDKRCSMNGNKSRLRSLKQRVVDQSS